MVCPVCRALKNPARGTEYDPKTEAVKPRRTCRRTATGALPCAGVYREKGHYLCIRTTDRKALNPDSPDTPMKRFLRSSPACARLWKLLGKDIQSVREEIYAGLKTQRSEDGK